MNHKLNFLFDLKHIMQRWGLSSQQASTLDIILGIFFIILLAYFSDILSRRIIMMVITRLIARTKTVWDDILLEKKVFSRLSHLAPAIVLWYSAEHVLTEFEKVGNFLQILLSVYMIFFSLLIISSFLKGLNEIYQTLPVAEGRSIKGYIQVAQIIFFCIAFILIISIITGSSPKALLTGLGAATAVLMLIFKDAILGLVAGIQLSANKMLRIGDRITLPNHNADGNVTEITLTTVKVMNFDNTVSTIPPYTLVSEPFINWRTMVESGGRRFIKHINIDVRTIEFCSPELMEKLKKFRYLHPYIEEIQQKMLENEGNKKNLQEWEQVTNLGLFRKYAEALLMNHPLIRKDMTIGAYHQQPTEAGIPLELVAYSSEIDWKTYVDMQGEIFEHLFSVIGEFGLKIFQRPAGDDFMGK